MKEQSIFTQIMDGDIPANIIYEDSLCICIHDIQPQAPTHVLLIPRKPIRNLASTEQSDAEILSHLLLCVNKITRMLGIEDAFRVIVNNGEEAGQTVFHLHLHILAGKKFKENSLSTQ